MPYPSLSHHGGDQTVTGSCHQLHLDAATSLLIDCGLEQGAHAASGLPSITFDVTGIEAVVLTHVHLDHVGRLPALFAEGYRGPILCSEASAKLLPLVLEDAYKLSVSNDPAEISRYLAFLQSRLQPLPFDRWHDLVARPDLVCRVRLRRAGHLLGSAYVECDVLGAAGEEGTRIVFSGDLGTSDSAMLRRVEPPERADLLVLESTYGDRLHGARGERRDALEAIIDRALADRGTVLIPAFSLGRTQELLFDLEDILHRKALRQQGQASCSNDLLDVLDWAQLPIILDSPLAQRITQVYRDLNDHWNVQASQRLQGGAGTAGLRTVDQYRYPWSAPAGRQLSQEHRQTCDRHRRQWHVFGRTHRRVPESHAARSSA